MKRLAILLGQSRYLQLPQLQACANDLRSMRLLLESTACFDRFLVLDDSVETALAAKEQLGIFLAANAAETVGELFFYFTGHGHSTGDEFLYLWNDFDPAQQQETSLSSSEIDRMLMKVRPELLIKVVDACYAESLKSIGPGFPDDHDNISKKLFKNLYCLFSCQKEQHSFADSTHSFFTSLFLQAVNRPLGTRVRYRDIIDFISGAFEKIGRQTPVFVTHADFTAQFCIVTKKVKQLLQSLDLEQQKQALSKLLQGDLLDRVRLEAAQYVALDEAKQCLLCGVEALNELQLDLELSNYFRKEVQSTTEYAGIPEISKIAEALAASDHELFVKILYDTAHYTIKMPVEYSVSGPPDAVRIATRMQPFIKSRQIPQAFENSFDLPYVYMQATLKPQFANLLSQAFILVPILSRTRLYYFYTTATYKRVDWDDQVIETSALRWEYAEFDFDCYQIKIQLTKLIEEKFLSNVLNNMKLRFGVL
jgi:hypothetical protein